MVPFSASMPRISAGNKTVRRSQELLSRSLLATALKLIPKPCYTVRFKFLTHSTDRYAKILKTLATTSRFSDSQTRSVF